MGQLIDELMGRVKPDKPEMYNPIFLRYAKERGSCFINSNSIVEERERCMKLTGMTFERWLYKNGLFICDSKHESHYKICKLGA